MTREEMLALPPGRELDKLVAKAIGRGQRQVRARDESNAYPVYAGPWLDDGLLDADALRGRLANPPCYSSQRETVWPLVEWLHDQWGSFSLACEFKEWRCMMDELKERYGCWGTGDTVELALCRAVLITKG